MWSVLYFKHTLHERMTSVLNILCLHQPLCGKMDCSSWLILGSLYDFCKTATPVWQNTTETLKMVLQIPLTIAWRHSLPFELFCQHADVHYALVRMTFQYFHPASSWQGFHSPDAAEYPCGQFPEQTFGHRKSFGCQGVSRVKRGYVGMHCEISALLWQRS